MIDTFVTTPVHTYVPVGGPVLRDGDLSFACYPHSTSFRPYRLTLRCWFTIHTLRFCSRSTVTVVGARFDLGTLRSVTYTTPVTLRFLPTLHMHTTTLYAAWILRYCRCDSLLFASRSLHSAVCYVGRSPHYVAYHTLVSGVLSLPPRYTYVQPTHTTDITTYTLPSLCTCRSHPHAYTPRSSFGIHRLP